MSDSISGFSDADWAEMMGRTDDPAASDTATSEEPEAIAAVESANAVPATSEVPASSTEPESAPAEPVAPVTPAATAAPSGAGDEELQARLAKADRYDEIQRAVARIAEQQKVEQRQRELNELAEEDPERAARIQRMIHETASPHMQRAQAMEQQVEEVATAASALHIAMRAVLTDEQIAMIEQQARSLQSFKTPDAMEQMAFAPKQVARQYAAQLTEKDAEIERLKMQLAAQGTIAQQTASGLHVVDGGSGGTSDTVLDPETAETWDDYWNAMATVPKGYRRAG